jgi:hypothetical protein
MKTPFAGNQIRVTRVFGFQIRFALADQKSFQGAFAVDISGDDAAGARFPGMIEDGPVAIEDAGVFHGVALDAECEDAVGRFGDAECSEIHGDIILGGLGPFLGRAGGNGAIDGDVKAAAGRGSGGIDRTQGAGGSGFTLEVTLFGEGLDVIEGAAGAAESAVFLDFTEGRGQAESLLSIGNEIPNLLFFAGERGHKPKPNICLLHTKHLFGLAKKSSF